MSSTAFVTAASVPTRPLAQPISTCTFAARPTLRAATRARRAPVIARADGYKIEQSEYRDPDSDDDAGDGFIGEPDLDDMLGVSMPDDIASFEVREISASKNREELVDKLKNIASRRRGIRDDRRRGLGMDNVGNYLDKL